MDCAGRAKRRRRFGLNATLQMKRNAQIQPSDCQLTPTPKAVFRLRKHYGATGALRLPPQSICAAHRANLLNR
jgi:hypothetical protein